MTDENITEETVAPAPAKKTTPTKPKVEEVTAPAKETEAPLQSFSEQTSPFGHMVRYVTAEETIRPAVVTAVHADNKVDLTVFNSSGAATATNVPHEELDDEIGPIAHTYHWPQR